MTVEMAGLLDTITGKTSWRSPVSRELDTSIYVDRAWAAREQTYIFDARPIVVAAESELVSVGDFLTLSVGATPIILVRTSDQIRCFLNICPHRGSPLVIPQSGSMKRFVCPFHAWTFSLEGKAPTAMLNRELSSEHVGKVCLTELNVEMRYGLIWVSKTAIGNQAAHLDDYFAATLKQNTDKLTASRVIFDSVVEFNWKLGIDAFLEAHHISSIHQSTIAREFPYKDVQIARHGLNQRFAVPRAGPLDRLSNPGGAPFSRFAMDVSFLFPNALLIVHEKYSVLVFFLPCHGAPGSSRARVLMRHVDRTDGPFVRYIDRHEALTKRVVIEEDFAAAARVQSNINTSCLPNVYLSRSEAAVQNFYEAISVCIPDQ